MRIIEPRNIKVAPKKQKPVVLYTIIVGLILLGVVIGLVVANIKSKQRSQNNPSIGTDVASGQFKYYTDDDFQMLVASIAYPNTHKLASPPTITGNSKADVRIRRIAESRGYVQLPVPKKLSETQKGVELQTKAALSWQDLSRRAAASDINLHIRNAYVSVDSQRGNFLRALRDQGFSADRIASGKEDLAIAQLISYVAVPGFSALQTGYGINITCKDIVRAFSKTDCYDWLQKDDYSNAKKSGWIPVDPTSPSHDKLPYQGFIWVGEQAVKNG